MYVYSFKYYVLAMLQGIGHTINQIDRDAKLVFLPARRNLFNSISLYIRIEADGDICLFAFQSTQFVDDCQFFQ